MKALIPAAGSGTRWYPWSKVVPKELLPLSHYPVLHYVLEETVAAEIYEIGIIINRAKQLIKKYVDEIWALEHPDAHVKWFYQVSPRGVTDALLCAKEWVKDSPTAVLYPDEIHPIDGGVVQLLKAHKASRGCWLGLTNEKQNRRQAVLKMDKTGKRSFRVYGLCEEELKHEVGYGTGRYILDAGLTHVNNHILQTSTRDSKELDDDKVFESLWVKGVKGLLLPKPIFDVGTPENWLYTQKKFRSNPKR